MMNVTNRCRLMAASAALLVAALAAASPVAAQDRSRPERPGRVDRDARGGRDARLRETVELYLLMRVKEDLRLTSQQEEAVMPLLREQFRMHRQRSEERRRIAADLKRMLRDGAPDGEILGRINDLHELEEGQHRRRSEIRQRIGRELDPAQQARMILFQDRFFQEIQDRVRDIRHRRQEDREARRDARRDAREGREPRRGPE